MAVSAGVWPGRRWGLGCVVALALLSAAVPVPLGPSSTSARSAAAAALSTTPPNVLLILVDDMRDDELRYMPQTRAWIRKRGVRFVNSFSNNPLCCPARASILTGRYSHNHRVYDTKAPYAFHSFDDRSTLATWLRRAGYATLYIGKYLNKYGSMPPPRRKEGKSLRYVPPGWRVWRASIDGGIPSGPKDGGTYRYFDTTLSMNGKGLENFAGQYQTEVYGKLAERLIQRHAPRRAPFFLHLSFTATHSGAPREKDDPRRIKGDDGIRDSYGTPARPNWVKGRFDRVIREAPGTSWRDPDISDKPRFLRRPPLNAKERAAARELARQRAEALFVVDVQVGRIMRALRRTGELRDTVVMFTSDNGYYLGEQRRRTGKKLPHEPSLRVPFVIRGPGIPAGEVRRDAITSIDLAPTIAEFAGIHPGKDVDGLSLATVARLGDQGWTRPLLTESGPMNKRRWPTTEAGVPTNVWARRDVRFALGVWTPRYMYIAYAGGNREMYDMTADPQQYRNLIHDPAYRPEFVLLRRLLKQLRACDLAECRIPIPAELGGPPT